MCEVNADLNRQYTMTVTFDGSFLCLNELQMSQNGKLLILTTKAMIK